MLADAPGVRYTECQRRARGDIVTVTKGGARFAERQVSGIDDAGATKVITLWVEWQPGGQWAVGRAVNLRHRENPQIPREDRLDLPRLRVAGCARGGQRRALVRPRGLTARRGSDDVRPFRDEELKRGLERWVARHAPDGR